MGLITTQVLGFGQPKPDPQQKADPKPVRGFNYAGEPMKEGDFYNGRPENMKPKDRVAVARQAITPPEYRDDGMIAAMKERMARARAKRWPKKRAKSSKPSDAAS